VSRDFQPSIWASGFIFAEIFYCQNRRLCGQRSMTPPTSGQRCHWHRRISDVFDTGHHWHRRCRGCNWHRRQNDFCSKFFANRLVMQILFKNFSGRWPLVDGVNDTADFWWAVSITTGSWRKRSSLSFEDLTLTGWRNFLLSLLLVEVYLNFLSYWSGARQTLHKTGSLRMWS
jgi:hypothetical protein